MSLLIINKNPMLCIKNKIKMIKFLPQLNLKSYLSIKILNPDCNLEIS
jgi:hypothetical protein